MAKQPKRLTRLQKMEQSRLAAAELKVFMSKPWWPVKAIEEGDAVEMVGKKLRSLNTYTADYCNMSAEQVAAHFGPEIQELKKYLDAVPVEFLEKGKVWLAEKEAAILRSIEYEEDDYDPEAEIRAEEQAQRKWRTDVEAMSVDELKAYSAKLADEQGRLGDEEEINDSKVEAVENKWRFVNNVLSKRKQVA